MLYDLKTQQWAFVGKFQPTSVYLCCWDSSLVYQSDVIAPLSAILSAATNNGPHYCSAGPAGFPGGAPAGMPGLGEFLKDPELLNAMKVIKLHNINALHPTTSTAVSHDLGYTDCKRIV